MDRIILNAYDNEHIFANEILPEFAPPSISSHTRPKAIILAGQPGAGKGWLARQVAAEWGGDVVTIDPDELREFHPDFEFLREAYPYTWSEKTHADTRIWTQKLLNAAINGKKNLLYDTTLANGSKAVTLVHRLQAQGYEVNIRAMATAKLESELGVDRRFTSKFDLEGVARYVPRTVREHAYTVLPDVLNKVHMACTVSIRIFDREGRQLYDNRHDGELPGEALVNARQTRLQDECIIRKLCKNWQTQVNWHDRLPQTLAMRPEISPACAASLLRERDVANIVFYVREYARQSAMLDNEVRRHADTGREKTYNSSPAVSNPFDQNNLLPSADQSAPVYPSRAQVEAHLARLQDKSAETSSADDTSSTAKNPSEFRSG